LGLDHIGHEPRDMILWQPLIQRRRHQHHRIRFKRPEPLANSITDLHTVVDQWVNMLKLNRGEQAIRIAHKQFSQTKTQRPGNRSTF
jgi:hypothetical protein